MQKKKAHTGGALFYLGAAIYVGLLILFAFQTWFFVDWLFPGDQWIFKLLTVICFDVMAVFWAATDLFYHFAAKGARTLVRWAWAITFILSLLASIFYLVIESMFRFQVPITPTTVDIGYGVTIFALTLNIIFLTFWIYQEWNKRHPHQDEYGDEDEPSTQKPYMTVQEDMQELHQPTQHVEQVFHPQLSQGGASADPLASRSTREWNGAKPQGQE